MAMEMHDVLEHDMDNFIKKCAHLFHNQRSRIHLSLSFYIELFKQHVNIVLQHVLAFIIKRKAVFARDVCSKPPITIRFDNLHASKIRRAMG